MIRLTVSISITVRKAFSESPLMGARKLPAAPNMKKRVLIIICNLQISFTYTSPQMTKSIRPNSFIAFWAAVCNCCSCRTSAWAAMHFFLVKEDNSEADASNFSRLKHLINCCVQCHEKSMYFRPMIAALAPWRIWIAFMRNSVHRKPHGSSSPSILWSLCRFLTLLRYKKLLCRRKYSLWIHQSIRQVAAPRRWKDLKFEKTWTWWLTKVLALIMFCMLANFAISNPNNSEVAQFGIERTAEAFFSSPDMPFDGRDIP